MKEQELTQVGNEDFVDELDLKKYLTSVDKEIENDLNKDFTLAILDKEEKKYVIETMKNASYTTKEILRLARTEKDANDKKEILMIAKSISEIFMKEIRGIAVLNRNVKDNYLLKYLLKAIEEESKEEENTIKEKVLRQLQPTEE